MTFLKISNIHTKVGNIVHLDNVSLDIKKGELIALLGATDSGKTSLLTAIAGLKSVDSGSIMLAGEDITSSPPEDRFVGFVFETFNLFPHLTVMENLLFGAKVRALDLEEAKEDALEVLRMMHMAGREHAYPSELSGGMKQRVAIARAIVAGAKILLLDEPFRALDAKIREELRYEIRRIVKSLGVTCIHATHETEEAMIMADRIAVLNEGCIEQLAVPEELFESPRSYHVATSIAETNIIPINDGIDWKKNRDEIESEILNFELLPNLTIRELLESHNSTLSNYDLSSGAKLVAVIRYSDISFMHPRLDRIKKQRYPFDSYDPKVEGKSYTTSAKITRTRLLGEYIRFSLQLSGDLNLLLLSKTMLDLDLVEYEDLIDSEVELNILFNAIKLFVTH